MLEADIRARLSSDPAMRQGLAVYDFGAGEEPAVFTIAPAPADCGGPLITITLEPSERDNTRGTSGLLLRYEIQIWGEREQSGRLLRRLAWRAYDLLQGHRFTPSGHTCTPALADPPTVSPPDPDGFPGYTIIAAVRCMEE